MMKPGPKPTKENSRPVADGVLGEKVRKARQILGQDAAYDEDLRRLERQGKL